MRYFVDSIKMAIALATAVIWAGIAAAAAVLTPDKRFAVPVLLVLAAVYLGMALLNGRTVRLSKEGARLELLGIRRLELPWSEIREVGVVGTRILHSAGSRRVGTKYIYFSPKEMTEDERFQMCLSWAPKDMIYLRYSEKRVRQTAALWQKEITLYNTAGLELPR